ncbi:MAG: ketoacyl-ACP synthase III [Pirellulales bacterium]|nr:ketoacyl-ACP synthase III [Pirellulales bacterium]
MKYAAIGPIARHLPERVETNSELADLFPGWDMAEIEAKTGVRQRHIAAPGECASDLAVRAAQRLFRDHNIDPASIDFVLLCTQTPDYPLPTTACLIQDRLGLPKRCGALDFNLGCSGFVYGVSLADGLIRCGAARRVLLLTAETYSKYIHPEDRSLRTIFGDAACATLIDAADEPCLSGFVFGTDGSGGDMLLVGCGGARPAPDAIKPRHRKRWASDLYMDGPELLNFTLDSIPGTIDEVLQRAGWRHEEIDFYLMHQATRLLLEGLQGLLKVDQTRLPILLSEYGNTVSSTVPLLIYDLRCAGKLRRNMKNLLVGFGVGLSWGGCAWRETWGG